MTWWQRVNRADDPVRTLSDQVGGAHSSGDSRTAGGGSGVVERWEVSPVNRAKSPLRPLALFDGNWPHDIFETCGARHKRGPERNPQKDGHDHFFLCGSVTLELHLLFNVLAHSRFR
jgi:hypothetical protein